VLEAMSRDDTPAGFARNDPSAMGDRIKGTTATAMTADLREALAELAALEDLRDKIVEDGAIGSEFERRAAEYMRRRGPAREAARAALAIPTAPAPEPGAGNRLLGMAVKFAYLERIGQNSDEQWRKMQAAALAIDAASPPHQTESES
jgi:hypothetical protein